MGAATRMEIAVGIQIASGIDITKWMMTAMGTCRTMGIEVGRVIDLMIRIEVAVGVDTKGKIV